MYWELRCTGEVRIHRLKKITVGICASLYILYNVVVLVVMVVVSATVI